VPYSAQVKSLIEATFLTGTPSLTFINEYLPIYRAMKYEIGYLYDSMNDNSREIPPEVLQINFQRLNVNSF
jgi:hypothetical protein